MRRYAVPVSAVRDTASGDRPLDGLGVYLQGIGELLGCLPPLQEERSQPLVWHSTSPGVNNDGLLFPQTAG